MSLKNINNHKLMKIWEIFTSMDSCDIMCHNEHMFVCKDQIILGSIFVL